MCLMGCFNLIKFDCEYAILILKYLVAYTVLFNNEEPYFVKLMQVYGE